MFWIYLFLIYTKRLMWMKPLILWIRKRWIHNNCTFLQNIIFWTFITVEGRSLFQNFEFVAGSLYASQAGLDLSIWQRLVQRPQFSSFPSSGSRMMGLWAYVFTFQFYILILVWEPALIPVSKGESSSLPCDCPHRIRKLDIWKITVVSNPFKTRCFSRSSCPKVHLYR